MNNKYYTFKYCNIIRGEQLLDKNITGITYYNLVGACPAD